MTVSNQTNKIQYTGNGSTTVFAIPFTWQNNSEISVILTTIATGVETTLTITTDYSLSGGSGSNGTMTTVSTYSSAYRLTILRTVPLTQESEYTAYGVNPASVTEDALDKLTQITQQNNEAIGRSLKTREGSSVGEIAVDDPQAGAFLQYGPDGTTVISSDAAAGGVGTYILPYPGAVTRGQTAKNIEIASVKDFYDNEADYTEAFERAINSGLSIVKVPAGTYTISDTIVATNAAFSSLVGEGNPTININITTGSLKYGFDFATNNIKVSVSGITFAGSNPATTQNESWYGGTFSYQYRAFNGGLSLVDGSYISDCRFQQLADACYIQGTTSFDTELPTYVLNCLFAKNLSTFTGILLNTIVFSNVYAYLGSEITFPSSRNIIIDNCVAFLPGTPGLNVGGSNAVNGEVVSVTNNISYARDPIVVEVGFNDIIITGNQCYSMSDSPNGVGIGVTTNTGGQGINRVLIDNNKVSRYNDPSGATGAYAFGILIDANIDIAVSNIQVTNNQVIGATNSIWVEGFDSTPRIDGVTITNNLCRDVRQKGITVINADRMFIKENNLDANTTESSNYGIYTSGIVRGRISNNSTLSFVTAHYYFGGVQSDVLIESPDNNATTEANLWEFDSVTGNLVCRNIPFPALTVPTIGNWAAGSQVNFTNVSANSVESAICTTTGSPGTWTLTSPTYEEGTWNPVVTSSGGTLTTVSATGTYTRTGRLVTLSFNVIITDNGTGSGFINIAGMPFNASTANIFSASFMEYAAVGFQGYCVFNTTSNIVLAKYDNTYPGGTGHRFAGTITYQI